MYSNNTFFLFYLLLFVTSKRKIHLIHPISLLHFHQLVQNPRFTQKLPAPPLPSVRGGLLHLGVRLEPFESEAPVCLPTRHTGWSSNLFEPWSATSSTKRTVRVERARPVLGKADVARNYRRTWRGLKKRGKKRGGERGKKDEGGEGTRHVALRQFFLMDGHGLSTLYTRWRCRNRLARSAKIIRSSSVKCNKRGANVQRGWVGGEGNCNIKFVGAWNALKFVSLFEYLIIRGAKKKGKKESNQREGLFSFSTEKNNSLSRSRV